MDNLVYSVGERLTEVKAEKGMCIEEFAEYCDIEFHAMFYLLNNGKRLSTREAKKLEKALGVKAKTLLDIQTDFELKALEFEEQNGYLPNQARYLDDYIDGIEYSDYEESLRR